MLNLFRVEWDHAVHCEWGVRSFKHKAVINNIEFEIIGAPDKIKWRKSQQRSSLLRFLSSDLYLLSFYSFTHFSIATGIAYFGIEVGVEEHRSRDSDGIGASSVGETSRSPTWECFILALHSIVDWIRENTIQSCLKLHQSGKRKISRENRNNWFLLERDVCFGTSLEYSLGPLGPAYFHYDDMYARGWR